MTSYGKKWLKSLGAQQRGNTLEFSDYKWISIVKIPCWEHKTHRRKLNLIVKNVEPLFVMVRKYRNYLISSNSMRVPEKSDGFKILELASSIFGLSSLKLLGSIF